MNNPIVRRELVAVLRGRKGLAMLLGPAAALALLVLLRWPSDARVAISGVQSVEAFRVFAYGLLAIVLLLTPVYPATSIVRERTQGTLALLLNSAMGSWSIYFGKLLGVLGFVWLPLAMSLPAAAACYALGGISLPADVLPLYGVLLLCALEYAALALLVSSLAGSTDSALRITFGLVLLLAVVSLGPHLFLQGKGSGLWAVGAEQLRCLSPIPAVMEIVGQGDVGGQGLVSATGTPGRFAVWAILISLGLMLWTATHLRQTMLDRPRPQGRVTDEQTAGVRWLRRLLFLFDPQRRQRGIGRWTNPVMVKEFRARRFGRSHWMARLVAGCAVLSLLLTFAATLGTLDWGVRAIGGIMVLLQVSLIVLVTPSLAAGLFSAEHETGGWTLLRMTPLSAGQIVRGKLASALATLLLILLATLPGYAVMMWIEPVLAQQITYVMVSLLLAILFALLLSAAVGSFFRRSAPATITAYAVLVGLYGGSLLVWLGRGAPFGHGLVRAALIANPTAAALHVLELPGFVEYSLVPHGWWFAGGASVVCLVVLSWRTWRLTRPQ